MRHRAKFHQMRQKVTEIWRFSRFCKMAAVRHPGFVAWAHIGPTHDYHFVVSIVVQNLVEIDAIVSIIWNSIVCQFGLTRSSANAEGPRDVSCQLKSCQLPRNSAETTCTTSPEQIEVMKLKRYSKAMCNKHVHSTMTRSSRFRCPVDVINKPTVELWISPVYRRLAVAKFSKSTM